jgi:hypothetical protein
MGTLRRVHALTNTFSGVAAEARVAAEMVRCGLRVAKPYWTDDEVDLIVLSRRDKLVIPVPVQVKSVQFLESKHRKNSDPRFIKNLKKRYVEGNAALCLMIYQPDKDKMWFIDGAENIRNVYEEDAKATGRTRYHDLKLKDDVAIRVTFDNCSLDVNWLVPANDAKWLSYRVNRITNWLVEQQQESGLITTLLDSVFQQFDMMPTSRLLNSRQSRSYRPQSHLKPRSSRLIDT